MHKKSLFKVIFTCLLAAVVIYSAHAGLYYTSQLDITYNNHGQQLDLYIPKKEVKQTAIMFIHGGGFNAGIKDDMTFHAKYFARKGYITTSINYRLGTEDIYPAAKNDALDAIQWMKKQATKYGFDKEKIVVLGYSAGGLLALNAGLDKESGVAAIISGAGVTDLESLILTTKTPELKYNIDHYMQNTPIETASPVNLVTKTSPPVLMFHGDLDNIVPFSQSASLAKQLGIKKIPYELIKFRMTGHDLMLESNPHIYEILQKTGDWLDKIEHNQSLK